MRRAIAATILICAGIGQWAGSIWAAEYVSWTLGLHALIGTLAAVIVFWANTLIGLAAWNWGEGRRWDHGL